MASKIDPDAAPLYKEIKVLHAAMKRAVKEQPLERVEECLKSVFASRGQLQLTDEDQRLPEEASFCWRSPVAAKGLGAMFHVDNVFEVDERAVVMTFEPGDKWIYGAMLPLSVKLQLHTSWQEVLRHVIRELNGNPEHKPALFNWWDEQVLIENTQLKFSEDEDEQPFVETLNEDQIHHLQAALQALKDEPDEAKKHWPNLAPWLEAVQTLLPAPPMVRNEPDKWVLWCNEVKVLYLNAQMNKVQLELPQGLDASEDLTASSLHRT